MSVDGFNDAFGVDFRSNIGTDTILLGLQSFRDWIKKYKPTRSGSQTQTGRSGRLPIWVFGYSMTLNTLHHLYRQEMGFLNQSGCKTSPPAQFIKQLRSRQFMETNIDVNYREEFDADGFINTVDAPTIFCIKDCIESLAVSAGCLKTIRETPYPVRMGLESGKHESIED